MRSTSSTSPRAAADNAADARVSAVGSECVQHRSSLIRKRAARATKGAIGELCSSGQAARWHSASLEGHSRRRPKITSHRHAKGRLRDGDPGRSRSRHDDTAMNRGSRRVSKTAMGQFHSDPVARAIGVVEHGAAVPPPPPTSSLGNEDTARSASRTSVGVCRSSCGCREFVRHGEDSGPRVPGSGRLILRYSALR